MVAGVDFEGLFFGVFDDPVVKAEVSEDTAATAHEFDADAAVGADGDAVAGGDVADAAGGLAADDAGAVALEHDAVGGADEFGGAVGAETVVVAAGFDHDAVVARVEEAIGDADVAGGVDVDAVAVGPFAFGEGLALGIGGDEADAAHDDIVAVDGVAHPHGEIEEGDVGDEDVFAVIETDEGRAEELGGPGEVGGGEFFAGFDAVVEGAPRGLVGGGVLAGWGIFGRGSWRATTSSSPGR